MAAELALLQASGCPSHVQEAVSLAEALWERSGVFLLLSSWGSHSKVPSVAVTGGQALSSGNQTPVAG